MLCGLGFLRDLAQEPYADLLGYLYIYICVQFIYTCTYIYMYMCVCVDVDVDSRVLEELEAALFAQLPAERGPELLCEVFEAGKPDPGTRP